MSDFEPPNWLDRTAKALFRKLQPEITLNAGKAECLAVLCAQYSLYRQAKQAIDDNGLLIHTKTTTKQNPAITIQSQAYDQFLKMAKALGITKEATGIHTDELDSFFQET